MHLQFIIFNKIDDECRVEVSPDDRNNRVSTAEVLGCVLAARLGVAMARGPRSDDTQNMVTTPGG